MLTCREMAELVTRYLENALPARERIAARLHLWACAPCRRYLDQMRRTIRFLADGPPPAPSPEREDEIVELLTSRRRDR